MPVKSTLTLLLLLLGVVLAVSVQGASVTKCPAEKQHPVVFIPGLFFSMLDVRLTGIPSTEPLPHASCKRENKKFETMWARTKNLKPNNFDCLADYLKMKIDPVTGDVQNRAGVEVQPTRFGSTYGVERLDPDDYVGVTYMFHKMVHALKKRGFTENSTLYGAPYDWRLLPTTGSWVEQLTALIEGAYVKTGRRVVLVAHSMGCAFSHHFLAVKGDAWNKKFIEHWFPVSPTFVGAPTAMYFVLANATNYMPRYLAPACDLFRDIESMYYLTPKHQYGIDIPIAKTDKHVYTPRNVTELFKLLGVPHTTTVLNKAQKVYNTVAFTHPGVSTTVIYSLGVQTIDVVTYNKEEDVGNVVPRFTYTDGDGLVPKNSMLAYSDIWIKDPRYANITSTYEVTGKGIYHGNTVKDDGVMELIYKTICA